MMKIKNLLFLAVIALCSCSDKYCKILIGEIESQCSGTYDDCQFEFKDAFDFEWDKLYIFGSYEYPEEISEKLGIDCECDIVPDNHDLIIFIKDGTIVEKMTTSCYEVSYVQMRGQGGITIDRNTVFRMERRMLNGKHQYYFFKE